MSHASDTALIVSFVDVDDFIGRTRLSASDPGLSARVTLLNPFLLSMSVTATDVASLREIVEAMPAATVGHRDVRHPFGSQLDSRRYRPDDTPAPTQIAREALPKRVPACTGASPDDLHPLDTDATSAASRASTSLRH